MTSGSDPVYNTVIYLKTMQVSFTVTLSIIEFTDQVVWGLLCIEHWSFIVYSAKTDCEDLWAVLISSPTPTIQRNLDLNRAILAATIFLISHVKAVPKSLVRGSCSSLTERCQIDDPHLPVLSANQKAGISRIRLVWDSQTVFLISSTSIHSTLESLPIVLRQKVEHNSSVA